MAAVLLSAGCKQPLGTGATAESVVKGRPTLDAGAVRLLKVLRADGQPVADGTAMVDGRAFPIKDGAIAVSETVFQEGQRLGNLLIMANGYAPVRLAADAALAGITLSPLLTLGPALTIDAAGGKLTSADGSVAVYVPAGLLDGGTSLALGAYAPGGQDAVAAAYQQDQAKLYRSRGQVAPAAGGCAGPLACLPVKTALGLAVALDASATGNDGSGNLTVELNLRQMLNGWSGQGTPPWQAGATGWTEAQKQQALAAAQLLAGFQAMDATGDASWRTGMKGAFGLTLANDVLTIPVAADPGALLTGFTKVSVPGSELLGVRLELTVTTKDVNSAYGLGSDGKPLDPGQLIIPQAVADSGVMNLPLPAPDSTGQAAVALRTAQTVPGNGRPGSTLQDGLSLAVAPPATATKASATGSLVTGPAALYDPNIVAGQTTSTLIANNASGIISGNGSQLTGAATFGPTQVAGTGIITNNGSQIVANNGTGIVANNGTGIVANNGTGIVANNGTGIIANNAGGIVANNAGGIIANNAGGIVADNGAGLVANNGGMLTGFPYLPIAPLVAKLQLLAIGVPTAPGVRRTAGGVTEYLWPDALSVRAIDVEGTPLTNWVTTDGQGYFQLPLGVTPPVFFLECSDPVGKIHVYSQVFAPGSKTALAAVDSSTNMVAISTVHLYNFIPPEKARLSALSAQFKSSKDATAAAAKGVNTKSPLFQALAKKVAAFQAGQAMVDARIAELDRSWDAFDPNFFGRDRVAADPVIDQATAEQNAKSPETESIYNSLYDRSSTGQLRTQSLLPITLVSPF